VATDLKDKCETDYKDKLRAFSNWVTSIVIANFVYLISLKSESDTLVDDSRLYITGFICLILSLILIFIFKVIDILSARMRLTLLEKGETWAEIGRRNKPLEEWKVKLFWAVLGLGLFATFISSYFLFHQVFKVSI